MVDGYSSRLRALNSAYRIWLNASEACAYCGVVADTYDHVPNLAMVHALGREHFEKERVSLWLVPACRECNSLLTKSADLTVTGRRASIKVKLRKRYAKLLQMPSWTEDELDGLGRGLQDMVRSGADLKDWIKRRLAW